LIAQATKLWINNERNLMFFPSLPL
jgi:hypothetical protein